jgi:hypothetical protein
VEEGKSRDPLPEWESVTSDGALGKAPMRTGCLAGKNTSRCGRFISKWKTTLT